MPQKEENSAIYVNIYKLKGIIEKKVSQKEKMTHDLAYMWNVKMLNS